MVALPRNDDDVSQGGNNMVCDDAAGRESGEGNAEKIRALAHERSAA